MSNRTSPLNPARPPRDPAQARRELEDAARQSLDHARRTLAEIKAALSALTGLSRPLHSICGSLSELTISAAGGVAQAGAAGRPLLPVVERLAGLARTSIMDVRDFQTGVGSWQRKLEALIEGVEIAQWELEPLLSELSVREPAPPPSATPPPIPADAVEERPAAAAASVFDVWPAARRGDPRKN